MPRLIDIVTVIRSFVAINVHRAQKGLLLREGTIVYATLIAARPSTKNRDPARGPEMVSGATRIPCLWVDQEFYAGN